MISSVQLDAHTWFRSVGAPLVMSSRERALLTLSRSNPILLWLIGTSAVNIFLWGQLAPASGESTFLSEWLGQLSEGTFLLAIVGFTLVPPLIFLLLSWQVSQLQRKYTLWQQNLISIALVAIAFTVLSPNGAALLGASELSESATAGRALLTVALVLLGVFFGVDSLLLWILKQTKAEQLSLVTMFAKVLPVLTVAVLFFFVNGDIWRVADALSFSRTLQVAMVLGMLSSLVALSTATEKTHQILGARHGAQLETYPQDDYAEVAKNSGEGWLQALADVDTKKVQNPPKLGALEWNNLLLLPFISQLVQAIFFALIVCLFFIWFGTITIPDSVVTGWLTHEVEKISVSGLDLPFSLVLVKVSIVLGAFAGLSFVAQTSTDSGYAEEFLNPTIRHVRSVLMMRNLYRAHKR